MNRLSVTLIDVGWGDSVLVESTAADGRTAYALIDSNDTTNFRSSQIFLKRFFERRDIRLPRDKPVFDFVLLSHAHSDHGQGLKALMREFGTRRFYYPKSAELSGMAYLLDFANRSDNVELHESLNSDKHLPPLGDAALQVLWPPYERIEANENNNSVILVLRLGQVAFVLTGDAEAEVWEQAAAEIPADTAFFKVPHHGSVNGFFGPGSTTPWLDRCPADAQLGISTHVVPFHHPHSQVIAALDGRGRAYFRTDESYHVTFTTDGRPPLQVKYSRV